MTVDRRTFLERTAAATAALAWPSAPPSTRRADDLAPIFTEIEKRHDEAVSRLQEWIRQPSIAAENRGVNEGCDLTMRLLKDAGFDQVTKIPTDGQPGIVATLDAGAPRTLGLYFMYDVKQADPAEWSSPPWDAALVDRPGLGKVIMGRGAVNPRRTFTRATRHASTARRGTWSRRWRRWSRPTATSRPSTATRLRPARCRRVIKRWWRLRRAVSTRPLPSGRWAWTTGCTT